MEGRDVGQARGRQVLHGTYGQVPVGMPGPEVLSNQPRQQVPVRPVVVALAFFLGHHVALGVEVLLGHREAAKAVRLQPQHNLQGPRRHAFVVDRAIGGSEGVDVSPRRFDHGHVFSRRHPGRTLEHQVLEQVGEAGAAREFVNGTHLETEVDRHGRGGRIGQQGEFEAVSQPISDDGESGRWGESGICHDSEIAALLTLAPAFLQFVHEIRSGGGMAGLAGGTRWLLLGLDPGPSADSGDGRGEHHHETDDGYHGLELDPEHQGGQPSYENHARQGRATTLDAELGSSPQGVREFRVIGEQRGLKLVQALLLLLRQSHRGLPS